MIGDCFPTQATEEQLAKLQAIIEDPAEAIAKLALLGWLAPFDFWKVLEDGTYATFERQLFGSARVAIWDAGSAWAKWADNLEYGEALAVWRDL